MTPQRSLPAWSPSAWPALAGLCLALGAAGALPQAARAQSEARLDAQYEATLAGIPIGRGSWTIQVGDDQYAASAFGGTTGLLKAIANASGTGAVQGRLVNGALIGTNYTASTTTSHKTEAIHIVLNNGNVKEYGIDPTPPVDADRIPVTDAHRKGVLDPMTASLLRVPGTADPLSAEACRSSAAVFDGRMRYELSLAYKRMDTVKAQKGYHGPVVVCAIYFKPIAGYIPDRPVIKYLSTARNMEIAFAPLPGTRLLIPFRIVLPTPFGTGMLEATQFITQNNTKPPKTQ
ncbi:MAG: DUF3108 domain-containing protein [Gemmatimonas sp.]